MLQMTARTRRQPMRARYPGGQLKPLETGDIRAGTMWRRIKDHGEKAAIHPFMGTVLGRLSLIGLLTDSEVEAGFRVAEIVGRYDRLCIGARNRTAASPAYERSYGQTVAEDEGDQNTVARAERRARRAARSYDRLRGVLPAAAWGMLLVVCISDEEVSSLMHPDLKRLLARLAREFGFAR